MNVVHGRAIACRKEVIIRGVSRRYWEDHWEDHFEKMQICLREPRKPAFDAQFVAFYLGAPDSAITHIGVVQRIERSSDSVVFHLSCIAKLDPPVRRPYGVRRFEYTTLHDLGIHTLVFIQS